MLKTAAATKPRRPFLFMNPVGSIDSGKGKSTNVVIAQWLQRETAMTLAWMAERLRMGTRTYLEHLLCWKRRNDK